MKISRVKILSGVIIMWVIAIVMFYGMPILEAKLLEGDHLLFDYMTWQNGAIDNIGYRFLWAIGDLSEGTVHKTLLASLGVVIGGIIAHRLYQSKSKWRGYDICAGLGVFPWVMAAVFIGLFVSSALYGGFLKEGWVPTFLPGCTIPSAIVFMFGGGWPIVITAGIVCGIIQFPLGYLGNKLMAMIGLPSITGSAIFGMCIAGILIIEIFKRLPWITPILKKRAEEKAAANLPPGGPPEVGSGPIWLIRRCFADFTEIYFLGNEIAGLCLIVGVLLSWVMNPAHTGYGGPNFTSAILAGQFMASSIAIFFHYDKWQKFGWYNTFTASLGAGAFVLTFGPTLPVILLGAVLTGYLAPLFANFVSTKIFPMYHGVVGGTCGMGIAIAVSAVIAKGILPLIG